jgi:hypothetical protein
VIGLYFWGPQEVLSRLDGVRSRVGSAELRCTQAYALLGPAPWQFPVRENRRLAPTERRSITNQVKCGRRERIHASIFVGGATPGGEGWLIDRAGRSQIGKAI